MTIVRPCTYMQCIDYHIAGWGWGYFRGLLKLFIFEDRDSNDHHS